MPDSSVISSACRKSSSCSYLTGKSNASCGEPEVKKFVNILNSTNDDNKLYNNSLPNGTFLDIYPLILTITAASSNWYLRGLTHPF